MKLEEWKGKKIFSEYGIRIPKGFLAKSVEELKEVEGEVVVKAQVLVGGRGKSGGIKTANAQNIRKVTEEILGTKIKGVSVKEVLVEEKLGIKKEMYLSLAIDRFKKSIVLIFSKEGGVDIEELAEKNPKKIVKIYIKSYNQKEVEKVLGKELALLAEKLYKIMKDLDAELVEINPLAQTKEGLVAADAKIILDDNALFRHPEFSEKKEEAESEAAKYGLNYVELDGDIGVIGNGAGLVMATLDVLDFYGAKAANFLDVGGGASVERMEKALEIVLKNKPKKVFINIFGGITRCDEIAKGLVNYKQKNSINIPIVVRMIGTNEEEGRKILEKAGISCLDSMEECAKKIAK